MLRKISGICGKEKGCLEESHYVVTESTIHPALSAADVGIAISDGAEIAREIADITISADDLYQIVTLKLISDALMKKISKNYKQIVGFNTGLIALGVAGVIQPAISALLHNTSTLVISLKSMQNLLT